MDFFLELLSIREVPPSHSLSLISSNSRSPVLSLIPRSVVPSVVGLDSIMLVPVLGGPWAVWYTLPTLSTAALPIAAHLVAELTILSFPWAFALRSISTGRERLVVRSKSLSCGAFHLVLGAQVEHYLGL